MVGNNKNKFNSIAKLTTVRHIGSGINVSPPISADRNPSTV